MPVFEFDTGPGGLDILSGSSPFFSSQTIILESGGVDFIFSGMLVGLSTGRLEHVPGASGGYLGASVSNLNAVFQEFMIELTDPGQSFTGSVLLNFTQLSGNLQVRFDAAGTTADVTTSVTAGGLAGAAGSFERIIFTFTTSTGAGMFQLNDITTNISCFCAGTRIATPEGDVPVEALEEGTILRTADGGTTRVRWVGTREVDPRWSVGDALNPVCIRAGALGNTRDLYLSPDHAVALGGCLVTAGALVDESNTAREVPMAAPFTYYHIETEAHELILAEGLAVETYLPQGSAIGFDNAVHRPQRDLPEMDLPRITTARVAPMISNLKRAS